MIDTVKSLTKGFFKSLGYTIAKRDRLAELIPADYYMQSALVPRVFPYTLGRIFHFREMVELVGDLEGDIVECGVSVGHGILYFMLLSELRGRERTIVGFDSFEGFPKSTGPDAKVNGTFQVRKGDWSTPQHMVEQVLRDGWVSPRLIENNLRLYKGYFEKTLPEYEGKIALLHLDCDLYESYKTCLAHLYDKVVPGGVIMFDEYEDGNFPGAKRAVDEFFADKKEFVSEYNKYRYIKYYIIKTKF